MTWIEVNAVQGPGCARREKRTTEEETRSIEGLASVD